jgi:hypothetical protein
MEDSHVPDTILAALKEWDGKKINTTHVNILRERLGDDTIRLDKQHGMTNLEWGGYSRSGGNEGGSLLIAYSVTHVTINAAWVEEKNGPYFKGLQERNRCRRDMMQATGYLRQLDDAITVCRNAQKALDELLEHPNLRHDRTSIEKELVKA